MMEIAQAREAQRSKAFGRILVMDDEGDIRKLLGKLLPRLGYEASCTATGEEAVLQYRTAIESGRRFDAVILDLSVHVGAGAVRAIQELMWIDPTVKAIVSSGYSNDPVMADPKRYGFYASAAKPYGAEELGRILRKVLGSKEPSAIAAEAESSKPTSLPKRAG